MRDGSIDEQINKEMAEELTSGGEWGDGWVSGRSHGDVHEWISQRTSGSA